jgi:hypothetical protein
MLKLEKNYDFRKELQEIADEGKTLTDGNRYHKEIEIFVEDLDKWTEIDLKGQE